MQLIHRSHTAVLIVPKVLRHTHLLSYLKSGNTVLRSYINHKHIYGKHNQPKFSHHIMRGVIRLIMHYRECPKQTGILQPFWIFARCLIRGYSEGIIPGRMIKLYFCQAITLVKPSHVILKCA